MKKCSRRPNRRAALVTNNKTGGVSTESLFTTEAKKNNFVVKKAEGQDMLSKVKEYAPVIIKGYKCAF